LSIYRDNPILLYHGIKYANIFRLFDKNKVLLYNKRRNHSILHKKIIVMNIFRKRSRTAVLVLTYFVITAFFCQDIAWPHRNSIRYYLAPDSNRHQRELKDILSPAVIQGIFLLQENVTDLDIPREKGITLAALRRRTSNPALKSVLNVLPEHIVVKRSESALYFYANTVVMRLTGSTTARDRILTGLEKESEKISHVEQMGEGRFVQFLPNKVH